MRTGKFVPGANWPRANPYASSSGITEDLALEVPEDCVWELVVCDPAFEESERGVDSFASLLTRSRIREKSAFFVSAKGDKS
jgi:hypothetical protein